MAEARRAIKYNDSGRRSPAAPNPSRDLAQILDDLSAVVWEMNPDTWEFTFVSSYAKQLIGYPLERWHRPGFWAERLHPDDREKTVEACKQSIALGEDHFLEYRMVAADGRSVWVRDAVRVTIGDDGKPALVSGVIFEITHLKHAEQAWRVSEDRFTRFAEASSECVIIHDNGKVLEVNEACRRMFGYDPEEMVGRMATEFCAPADRPRMLAHIAAGSVAPLEGEALRKDGTTFQAELTGRNVTLLGKQTRIVTVRDISARKKAERALQDAEIEYQTLFDEVSEAIVLTDDQLCILRVNRSACELSGMTEEQLRGRHLRDFIEPSELEAKPLTIDSLRAGEKLRIERVLRAPTGEEMIADISAKRLPDGRVLASVHDVTERRKAEAHLRQSELLFAKAFQTSRDAVILFRLADEIILDVNDAWVKTTGIARERAVGHSQLEFDVWGNEAERRKFHDALRTGAMIHDFPFSFRDQRGALRHAVMSAEVIAMNGEDCALVIGRDITDQTRLEQHLRQTQKLEAIGGVAGGIAHDFNNILTAIRAFSELALGSLPMSNPAREDVSEILKASDRAIALTRQLLTFSRQEVQNVRTISVNDVILDVAPMMRRLAGDRCQISLELSEEPGLVNADWGQLEQVLVNLVVNARDAMPKGGEIRVTTANSTRSPDREKPYLLSGEVVVISVCDAGVGMDEETRERMFEPFFTTKSAQGGTGLGLSTVYGIVKQSSGSIDVESKVGEGATFRIMLPRITGVVPSGRPSSRERRG